MPRPPPPTPITAATGCARRHCLRVPTAAAAGVGVAAAAPFSPACAVALSARSHPSAPALPPCCSFASLFSSASLTTTRRPVVSPSQDHVSGRSAPASAASSSPFPTYSGAAEQVQGPSDTPATAGTRAIRMRQARRAAADIDARYARMLPSMLLFPPRLAPAVASTPRPFDPVAAIAALLQDIRFRARLPASVRDPSDLELYDAIGLFLAYDHSRRA
ncbi:hypothetical protein HK405_011674, partial [Cladochytrium tenue]